MNKTLVITAITLVAVTMGMSTITPAMVQAEPAIIGKLDGVCGTFNGDGDLVVIPDCTGITVTTNSHNDKFIMNFHVEVTPSSTGKAVKHTFESTGIECGFFDGNGNLQISTDYKAIVSASGKSTLSCKF